MKNKNKFPLYIDPMVDLGFKKIFKDSGKKQLLIRPINAIFDLDLVDIDITESEHLGPTKEDRKAIFDLFCKSREGRQFIIEVQIAKQQYFLERALFYTTFPISKSAPRERRKKKKWDYNYPPVFFLGLLNFDIRHLDPHLAAPEQYIHIFSLRDEKTSELMTDRLRFAILEVGRFDKPKGACHSFEDRFLFMMKNLPTFVEKPELWDDPYFEELLKEAELANMTDRQQMAYMNSLMQKWDYQNTIDYARMEGREDVAREMVKDNVPVETIVKYTGLSEEQVRAL